MRNVSKPLVTGKDFIFILLVGFPGPERQDGRYAPRNERSGLLNQRNILEMIYYGCDIPEDLYYDIERDVWIRFDGEFAVLGMTDIAQTRCGKFAAVSFRNVGKTVKQGKALATVESAKWVGPFPAPFSCEIVEVNEAGFTKDILLANKEPYTTGWLVKVRPTNLENERAHLATGQEAVEKYQERIKELEVNCFRCVD